MWRALIGAALDQVKLIEAGGISSWMRQLGVDTIQVSLFRCDVPLPLVSMHVHTNVSRISPCSRRVPVVT